MKELVGSYRIQSMISQGGMGVVYRGVHDHLGREVAVKALAPDLTQHPRFRERFFAEARAQAKLQHPNIVTIYDLIEDAEIYFIVMEYVPGPTLEALLKKEVTRTWETGHTLALFRQILAGLSYAHSKGVIHRDVKPSNVLITDGDQIKLTDFGIALLVGDKRLTASQSTIGTPSYMSPEQILRPLSVDHRSDVYSAAIVLFEMLAGQPPFEADTEYEIMKLQIEAPPPDIRTINPKIPVAIAEAINTALSKDPNERFQSADAFLRAIQEDVPHPIPKLQGKKRWIALAAAVLVLLVGLWVAYRILSPRGDQEEVANAAEVSPPPVTEPFPVSESPAARAASPTSDSSPAVQTLPNQAHSPRVTDSTPRVVPNDEPLRVGGPVSRPELISGPPPDYTELARKARVEGAVVVKAIIDEHGNVKNAQVIKGLPLGLDKAALEAVQNWKFSPATLKGQPVKVYYSLTVNFQVESANEGLTSEAQ